MASLREVGNAVAAFLVEYVVIIVVSKNLVEVGIASDTDDLAAGITAAIVVVVAFVDVVFDHDYIVCVAVVAGAVVVYFECVDFVVFAAGAVHTLFVDRVLTAFEFVVDVAVVVVDDDVVVVVFDLR